MSNVNTCRHLTPMIIKICLPVDWWNSIIEYGDFYKNPDSLGVILRANFIPRIKEMVYDYNRGFVNWAWAKYKPTLAQRFCYLPYDFVVAIEELLCKERLFIEFEEVEKLLSYFLILFLCEKMEEHKIQSSSEGYSY